MADLPNGKVCVASYHMWRLYPTRITTRYIFGSCSTATGFRLVQHHRVHNMEEIRGLCLRVESWFYRVKCHKFGDGRYIFLVKYDS